MIEYLSPASSALSGAFFTNEALGKPPLSYQLVQLLSPVQLFVTPWTATLQAPLSIGNSQSLLKLMSIELMMSSNHLILCHPLLLLPSIFPHIRVFSTESAVCIRWPKYWNFSISPPNEYSGLISFRIDWLDLLAVQGNSQESSPAPQLESIHSLALSLLEGLCVSHSVLFDSL